MKQIFSYIFLYFENNFEIIPKILSKKSQNISFIKYYKETKVCVSLKSKTLNLKQLDLI